MNGKKWFIWAATLALLALLVASHVFAWRQGGAAARLQLARAEQGHADKTVTALQTARQVDDRIDQAGGALQTGFDQREKEARDEATNQKLRAAAAEYAADGLRQQLAAVRADAARAGGQANEAASLARDLASARAAATVLADLYERADARAGAVEQFADAAHAAGQHCERDYDAARGAVSALDSGLGLRLK